MRLRLLRGAKLIKRGTSPVSQVEGRGTRPRSSAAEFLSHAHGGTIVPHQLRQRLDQAAPALLALAQCLFCDAALVVHRASGVVALLVQQVEASAPMLV